MSSLVLLIFFNRLSKGVVSIKSTFTYFLSSNICGPMELFSLLEFVAKFADEKMARRLAK